MLSHIERTVPRGAHGGVCMMNEFTVKANHLSGYPIPLHLVATTLRDIDIVTDELARPPLHLNEATLNYEIAALVIQLIQYVELDDLNLNVACVPELLLRARRMTILGALNILDALPRKPFSPQQRDTRQKLRWDVEHNTSIWLPSRYIAEGTGFVVLSSYTATVYGALAGLGRLENNQSVRDMINDTTGTSDTKNACAQIRTAIRTSVNLEAARHVWPQIGGCSLAWLSPLLFRKFCGEYRDQILR